MNIIDKLVQYTEFSCGDLSKKCELIVENQQILETDFSKYDLNNSYFLGVRFIACYFDNVYLSGSNFGGSSFELCRFKNNTLRKAQWENIFLNRVIFVELDGFRTSFYKSKFICCNFSNCHFKKCDFSKSEVENVQFTDCEFKDIDFGTCTFKKAEFKHCKFNNVIFPGKNDIENITFIANNFV